MSNSGLDRLAKLSELNANPGWINDDLYRMMFREDLYIVGYEKIKSQPGNMTPGIDGTTLDGFSIKGVIKPTIESMRTEAYQFSKGRRIYIPKSSGKGYRPITIAPPREKVVQEVMRMILEAIFDSDKGSSFLETSHGFRRGMGTHSALETIRRRWSTTAWIIEGDIKGCFDNIDHHVLVNLLRKRITDERFLNLVWKALRAGYMEGTVGFSAEMGSPQGSIISPILANVYLHELDQFVEGLKTKYERGKNRRWNPEYRRLQRQKGTAEANGQTDLVRELAAQMRAIPSFMTNDPDYVRIRYIRYADDWMIGVSGPKEVAVQLKEEVREFLKEHLKLTLSEEKTHIRHARTESAKFLGTLIRIQGGGSSEAKVTKVTRNGETFLKRTTGWLPSMHAPIRDILTRLQQNGFCTVTGSPRCKLQWVNLTHEDILLRYNATLRGILNYYSFVDNRNSLAVVQYILHRSAAKTLATKYRLRSSANVFKTFGRQLTAKTEVSDKTVKETHFWLTPNRERSHLRFQTGEVQPPLAEVWNKRLTRSHLGSPCCICGSKESVQMHHLRHVRDNAGTTGFSKVMGLINRKQIPVCLECHGKIHRGEYDGISLKEFAFNPAIKSRYISV